MANAGRSPRSIQYVFATFRAIWNHARNNGFVQVQSPTKGVALPKVNNERKCYLTRTEADSLLAELADRRARGSVHEADVGVAPVAVPYVRILLSDPMEIKARDLGRVLMPSMAAFCLHKLRMASERRKDDKRLKDYRQVEAVAKAILSDPPTIADVKRIVNGLHKNWVKKMVSSASKAGEDIEAALAVLRRAGIIGGE